MCPSKSKWCSRFFCVFRGPVSVKKGTIRKTYFITSPTLPPFSQSWCEDFRQSQAEWKKVPSLQYWMCQFRESTLTEWGKGSGSYEICFSDGTFFSQIPEQKKTAHNFSQTYSGIRLPNLCFSKELNHQKRFQEEPLGVSVFLALCFWGLEASQLIEGTFGIWRNLSSSASTRH